MEKSESKIDMRNTLLHQDIVENPGRSKEDLRSLHVMEGMNDLVEVVAHCSLILVVARSRKGRHYPDLQVQDCLMNRPRCTEEEDLDFQVVTTQGSRIRGLQISVVDNLRICLTLRGPDSKEQVFLMYKGWGIEPA